MQMSSLLKTKESHSSLVWLMECSIYISMFWLSQKSFSDISSMPSLVDVQRVHENGKRSLFFSNEAKWFSVRLQTKCLWNQFLLYLVKLQM